MFYDVKDFPFLEEVIKNISVIHQELKNAEVQNPLINSVFNPSDMSLDYYTDHWVADNGFHEKQIGYDIRDGEYATLAIYKKDYPLKQFDSNQLFPKTLELLSSVPGLYYSGFFKMYAGTHLNSHTHTRKHLIFHLLLNDLENGECVIKCGEETRKMKCKGDTLLFDYSYDHESDNNSDTDRLHFIIDFNPF